jgi:hypothetical protein
MRSLIQEKTGCARKAKLLAVGNHQVKNRNLTILKICSTGLDDGCRVVKTLQQLHCNSFYSLNLET